MISTKFLCLLFLIRKIDHGDAYKPRPDHLTIFEPRILSMDVFRTALNSLVGGISRPKSFEVFSRKLLPTCSCPVILTNFLHIFAWLSPVSLGRVIPARMTLLCRCVDNLRIYGLVRVPTSTPLFQILPSSISRNIAGVFSSCQISAGHDFIDQNIELEKSVKKESG